jgi:hypothetical protein
MAKYTTTELLASIRSRGAISSSSNSSNPNSDAGLLRTATEEMLIKLLPLIMSVREEFYVNHVDLPIVGGKSEYAIPERASGMVLRDVQIVEGTSIFPVQPVDSEQITDLNHGQPQSFYLRHDQVVLYPTPAASHATLRLRYFARPSTLVKTTEAAHITAINTVTRQVTVSARPADWTVTTELDLIKQTAPHSTLAIDVVPESIVANVFTFTSLPAGLAVGDWIAKAEESPLPQLPREFQPILAQMTVVKYLEGAGDREGSTAAWKDLQNYIESALKMITPRVVGVRKKIVSRNWK